MANELELEIALETKDALKGLNTFLRTTEETTKKGVQGFKLLDGAVASFAGNLASSAVIGAVNAIGSGISALAGNIKEFTNAASIQEDAVNRLNTQLALTGDFSQEASQDLQAFASALQESTRFGDESILNNIALAKSFGATNEQAKQIAVAATDLAESLGIDLESATRNVAKTLGGFAGELGESIPALKNLTKEQLQAGAGIDLLAQRFAGAASAGVQSFSGALQQTQNTIGDTQESLGELITQNPLVIAAIQGVGDIFKGFQDDIKGSQGAINNFVDRGISFLIDGLGFAIEGVAKLNSAFVGFQNLNTTVSRFLFETIQSLEEFALSTAETANAILSFFGQQNTAITQFIEAQKLAIESTQEVIDQRTEEINLRIEQEEQFTKTFEELSERVTTALKTRVEEAKKQDGEQLKSTLNRINLEGKAQKKAAADQRKVEDTKTEYEKLSQDQRAANLTSTLGQIGALTAQSNKELFAIGKAAALANAVIRGQEAIQIALSSAPPPFNFALAAAVGAAQAVQVSRIISQKPPAFQSGGIVGGSSFNGDNVLARVNSGEMIINQQQQTALFNFINKANRTQGAMASSGGDVVVSIDGEVIARAVRDQKRAGFVL